MACYSCGLVEVLAITCAITWDTWQVQRISPKFTPWYVVASNGDLGATGALQDYGTVKCCGGRFRSKAFDTRGCGGGLTNITQQHLSSIRMSFKPDGNGSAQSRNWTRNQLDTL